MSSRPNFSQHGNPNRPNSPPHQGNYRHDGSFSGPSRQSSGSHSNFSRQSSGSHSNSSHHGGDQYPSRVHSSGGLSRQSSSHGSQGQGIASICYNSNACAAARHIQKIEKARQLLLSRLPHGSEQNIKQIISVIDPKNVTEDGVCYLTNFLLSHRSQQIVSLLLQMIFRGELSIYGNSVFKSLTEIYTRSYNELTRDAENNFRTIYSFFSKTVSPSDRQNQVSLVYSMVTSIDCGAFTEKNLKTLKRVIDEYNNYSFIRNDESISCILTYKLLRFFQDYIIMSTSQICAPINPFIDNLRKLAQILADKTINLMIDLFRENGPKLLKKMPKDISRILFDPRSYARMSRKLAAVYQVLDDFPSNLDNSCVSDRFLVSKFLSFRYYKKIHSIFHIFCHEVSKNGQKARSDVLLQLTEIFAPDTDVFDIDLIAADVVRSMLQNPDFTNEDPLKMAEFLNLIFEKMKAIYNDSGKNEKKSIFAIENPFHSFFNAIASDLFFCPPRTPVDLKALSFFYPNLFFFFNCEQIQPDMINIIGARLKNGDFISYKRTSFATVLGLYEKLIPPPNSFKERLDANVKRLKSDKTYKDILSIISMKDAQSIPYAITAFHQEGKSINSAEGLEIIGEAAEFVTPLVNEIATSGVVNERCLQLINRTISMILPPNPELMPLVFDRIGTFPSFIYTTKVESLCKVFLQWVISKEKYDSLQESIEKIPKDFTKNFESMVSKFIREDSINWHELVQKVKMLRMSQNVMKTVCFYTPVKGVIEIADYDQFNVLGLIIEAQPDQWHPDACMNLITLLKCTLITAEDFDDNAEFFINNFSLIPNYVLTFMEQQVQLMGMSPSMNSFIRKLAASSPAVKDWGKKLLSSLVNQDEDIEEPQIHSRKPIIIV